MEILVGFRTDDGIVRKLDTMQVNQLPRLARVISKFQVISLPVMSKFTLNFSLYRTGHRQYALTF